jgi:hypothetical protein
MSFNFPNSPAVNDSFTPVGGPTYQWDGTVWRMSGTAGALVTAQDYNRVVNGAMQHSQENGDTGATSTGYWPADQWFGANTTSGTAYFARYALTSPNGSKYRVLTQVGTIDASVTASEYLLIGQAVEGIRMSDFLWGTASAKQVVLRFGVRCEVAGTFGGSIVNAASNRSYPFSYTISAGEVATDVYRTIVIPGDVTGTWPTDTAKALNLWFTFAAGATVQAPAGSWTAGSFLAPTGITNGMAVTAKTFSIFDVGLYLDPNSTGVAPAWVTPDYASELVACKRYWQRLRMDLVAMAASAGAYHGATYPYPVEMRVAAALATNADGSANNITTATFDSGTAFNCRNYINSTAAGIYAMAGRTGIANARM